MNYPLRIGLLLDHPSPHMRGLLESLAERLDVAARVVYLRRRDPRRDWPVDCGPLPYEFVEGAGSLNKTLARPRVDGWVIGSVYTSLSTWRAARLVQADGASPWAYMNEPMRRRGYLADGFKKFILDSLTTRACGFAMTGTVAMRDVRSGIARGRPCVSVPYFIPLQAFLDIPRLQPGSLGLSGPGGDTKIPVRFACIAQMVPRKRHKLLLEALAEFMDYEWTLDLVGDGPQRGLLERTAKQFGSKVRFRGALSYEERHWAFAQADAVILNSVHDGWGVAVQEALAAGCAVVATRGVMAARDLVEDGQHGYLIPVDDKDALVEALGKCIAQPALTRKMGVAGRQSLAAFSAADAADQLLALFRSAPLTAGIVAQGGASVDSRRLQATLHRGGRARLFLRRATLGVLGLGFARSPRKGDRILAYHFVPDDRIRRFEAHLDYLKDHFELVSLSTLVRSVTGPKPREDRLAITFDDGYKHLMGQCLELLAAKGITATFFISTAFARKSGDHAQEQAFCQRAHGLDMPLSAMSVEDLRQLQTAGHEIGSHGVQHLSLSGLTAERARDELVRSRETLSEWLGQAPKGFAYPYGDCHSVLGECSNWVQQAGYEYAVTMKRGVIEAGCSVFQLPREHAEGHWPLNDLRVFLAR